jgi:cell division septation protein DedD
MKNSETGEFELVVGNRQLLSGFFIVVLLLAVTFAMGYVVGENTRSAKLADNGAAAPGNAALDNRPQPASALPPAPPAAQPVADASPQPPADSSAAATAATAPAGQPPAQSASSGAPAAAATSAAPAANSNAPVNDLPPGSYWQVMALHQSDAEVLIRTLKDMGLPAVMSPAPNNLMRVLVGPYNDTESMGRVKSQLENAGFHPIKK